MKKLTLSFAKLIAVLMIVSTVSYSCTEEEVLPSNEIESKGSDGRGQDGEIKGF